MFKPRRSRRYCVDPDNSSMFCSFIKCKKHWHIDDFGKHRKTCEWFRDKLDSNNNK